MHNPQGCQDDTAWNKAQPKFRLYGSRSASPEWLWLSTGIRAVDHCVEGVCSNEAHVFGDAQALKGLALLASGLPRVKAQPKDLAARLDCQLGAWLSMGPHHQAGR
jgi:alcohol dehydrogenase class IV